MTTSRPHRLGGAIAALVAAALAAGCTTSSSSSDAAKTTSDLEKTNITVAAVPATDSAGLYVAQQQGLFAQAGLHVKIVPVVSSATAIAQQLSGQYDVTGGNYVSYILADAQDHDNLRILDEGSVMEPGSQVILTLPHSPITSVADLKNKTIGVNVLNNIGTILVGTALEENGVPVSDVHLVPIPFPEMTAALKAHRIDAAWVPEPFASTAEQTIGAQQLFDTDQGATAGFPIQGYAVTASWEKKYPRTAAAFKSALNEGQALADNDRADAEQAMMTFAGVSGKTAAIMAIDDYPLGVDKPRIARVIDAMNRFGLLKQPFNIDQLTSG
ncbi:MAG TPA: ABC transporter substrate-binding protein [Streptosporangiaceae bacterium]|nr:ABC transporter substrate-binding protein [Streptosporangiaceae bacterium]